MCTILFLGVIVHQPLCIVLSKKKQCPYEHPWLWTNNMSATPSPPPPPPPALVDNIVVSGTHALESAISSSRLHGAHHHVTASSLLHVIIDTMCINSRITSNKYFFSSFNDVDPLHLMLVDCCVLCCRGCGPTAAV